jgi:Zn-dependent M28 family amino/carboxypeptidase
MAGDLPILTPESYIEHVKFLASDALEGRKPGTEGIEKAATYIAFKFMSYGLEPAGVDNTFFQPFEVRGGKIFDSAAASLKFTGIEREWQVKKDFIPFPFTKPEDFEGPLVFAGYGISAPDFDYNDYADADVTGKVLLMFRYEPKAEDPKAEFGGENASSHAMFVKKANVAAEKGAKAILIVDPPSKNPDKNDLYEFTSRESNNTYRVPMIHVSRELAEALLKYAEMPDLTALEARLTQERKPLTQEMKLILASAKQGVKPIQTRNVMGILRGGEAPDEYIIVGGHYDHLGKGRRQFEAGAEGAEIHNGADDNASGSSGVLEMARVIAAGPRPRRSIIFMTFAAEEMGLLGSAHYVKAPTVPLSKIKAMVNFDMIGRIGQDALEIYGLPSAVEFPELVSKYIDPLGIKYAKPANGSAFFGASDHASFFYKGIPVLFPFTGTHKQYHKPEDDWERIDAEGATKLLSGFRPIIVDLANMTGGPTTPAKEKKEETDSKKPENPLLAAAAATEKAKKESEARGEPFVAPDTAVNPAGVAQAADAKPEESAPRRPRGGRVRLGIMPDYDESTGAGVLVKSVLPEGAAKKAGIQDGDRILRIGKSDVNDMEGYMKVLGELKVGDEVEVAVERGKEKLTFKVKIEGRPQPPEPK